MVYRRSKKEALPGRSAGAPRADRREKWATRNADTGSVRSIAPGPIGVNRVAAIHASRRAASGSVRETSMAIGKRTCVALTAQYAVGVEKGGIFVTKYVALAAANVGGDRRRHRSAHTQRLCMLREMGVPSGGGGNGTLMALIDGLARIKRGAGRGNRTRRKEDDAARITPIRPKLAWADWRGWGLRTGRHLGRVARKANLWDWVGARYTDGYLSRFRRIGKSDIRNALGRGPRP